MYPEGPIFASFNPVEIVSFLSRCADQEAEIHISDQEMTEVTLTTEFEFETMKEGQLELAFTLTSRYEDGSISFTISCIKEADGRILVFGDRSFAE
ncbi:hypothetical protein [Phycobacter azelaicus]|uniref:hypothetical protein n=1 Tax=Phycobacter azelaicus TaxID=2668075 RepID=UPI001A00D03F|nr:hypothetical protein [Phycobacter azelaicus]MBE1296561.1 hypothetical protein [Paracoccaceae bacterium]